MSGSVEQRYLAGQEKFIDDTVSGSVEQRYLAGQVKFIDDTVSGSVEQRYLAGQVNTLTVLCLGPWSRATWQVR